MAKVHKHARRFIETVIKEEDGFEVFLKVRHVDFIVVNVDWHKWEEGNLFKEEEGEDRMTRC